MVRRSWKYRSKHVTMMQQFKWQTPRIAQPIRWSNWVCERHKLKVADSYRRHVLLQWFPHTLFVAQSSLHATRSLGNKQCCQPNIARAIRFTGMVFQYLQGGGRSRYSGASRCMRWPLPSDGLGLSLDVCVVLKPSDCISDFPSLNAQRIPWSWLSNYFWAAVSSIGPTLKAAASY